MAATTAALSIVGVSDSPAATFPTPSQVDTSTFPNNGTDSVLGTLINGWQLYNNSQAKAVPTAQATAAADKPVNYLLIGGVALAAVLLLRK